MEMQTKIQEIAEKAAKRHSHPLAYGPYFLLSTFMWNFLSGLGLMVGMPFWAVIVGVVCGIISTTHLAIAADREWYIETALKRAGYDVKGICYDAI